MPTDSAHQQATRTKVGAAVPRGTRNLILDVCDFTGEPVRQVVEAALKLAIARDDHAQLEELTAP